jgi:hypothetical protein
MSVVKNKSTEENRQFWSHVEAVAEGVKSWPRWTENTSQSRSDEHPEQPGVVCPDANAHERTPRE